MGPSPNAYTCAHMQTDTKTQAHTHICIHTYRHIQLVQPLDEGKLDAEAFWKNSLDNGISSFFSV